MNYYCLMTGNFSQQVVNTFGMDVNISQRITSRISLLQIPNVRSSKGSLYIKTGRERFHSNLHLLVIFKTSIRNLVVTVGITIAQVLREWSKIPEAS
jgi:hypothetical protein